MQQTRYSIQYTHPIGAFCLIVICQTSAALLGGSLLLASLLFALLILAWARFYERRTWRSLGWLDRKWLHKLVMGLAKGLSLALLTVAIAWIGDAIELQTSFAVAEPLWELVGLLIVISICEEVVLRGWLLPNLTTYLGFWPGSLVSGLVFALLHTNNPHLTTLGFANLLLFGLIASLYLIEEQSLYGVIGLHIGWNLVQALLFGLPISGLDYRVEGLLRQSEGAAIWLGGGSFGLEGSLGFSLALVCLFGGLIWRFRSKRQASQ